MLQRSVSAGLLATLLVSVAPGMGAARVRAMRRWKIAFVSGLAYAPFYITMGHGIQAEAKAEGLPAPELTGSALAMDSGHQVPFLNAVVHAHPDLILISPADALALRAPILAATKAGIKVILVDTTLNDPSMAITTISTDNTAGGMLAADALARALGPKGGMVVPIAGGRGVSSTDQRIEGFDRASKKHSRLKVIGAVYISDLPFTGAGSSTNSYVLTAVAAAHKGLAGAFVTFGGASDTGSATSAAQEGIKLVEFDADPQEVSALKAGQVDALVAQYPYGIGQLAVRLGVDYLNGNHRLKAHYSTPSVVITQANVNDPGMANFLYTQ